VDLHSLCKNHFIKYITEGNIEEISDREEVSSYWMTLRIREFTGN
jgi:hypothetical protein